MTTTPVDRMAAALTAVSLIEHPRGDDLAALLPTELGEALTVLASTVTCAHMLASQLALIAGVTRDEITAELRSSINDAFKNDDTKEN